MTPTPIKRSKNLVPLSKDHHEGLLVTWKIRQGLRNGIAAQRITQFVLSAFDQHLEPHFLVEEQLLFKTIPGDDKLLTKAMDQHEAIRKMANELRANLIALSLLEAFANLLEAHIRFEERELFFHLEATVSAEVMSDIGARLAAIHENQVPLSWIDEFWVKK